MWMGKSYHAAPPRSFGRLSGNAPRVTRETPRESPGKRSASHPGGAWRAKNSSTILACTSALTPLIWSVFPFRVSSTLRAFRPAHATTALTTALILVWRSASPAVAAAGWC
jgi:hypothetical protein